MATGLESHDGGTGVPFDPVARFSCTDGACSTTCFLVHDRSLGIAAGRTWACTLGDACLTEHLAGATGSLIIPDRICPTASRPLGEGGRGGYRGGAGGSREFLAEWGAAPRTEELLGEALTLEVGAGFCDLARLEWRLSATSWVTTAAAAPAAFFVE